MVGYSCVYCSFVLFVAMRGKRWLCAVPRASLSVLTIVVIKRRISFDVSTKYNIPLKEDIIGPRLRKIMLKILKAERCYVPSHQSCSHRARIASVQAIHHWSRVSHSPGDGCTHGAPLHHASPGCRH